MWSAMTLEAQRLRYTVTGIPVGPLPEQYVLRSSRFHNTARRELPLMKPQHMEHVWSARDRIRVQRRVGLRNFQWLHSQGPYLIAGYVDLPESVLRVHGEWAETALRLSGKFLACQQLSRLEEAKNAAPYSPPVNKLHRLAEGLVYAPSADLPHEASMEMRAFAECFSEGKRLDVAMLWEANRLRFWSPTVFSKELFQSLIMPLPGWTDRVKQHCRRHILQNYGVDLLSDADLLFLEWSRCESINGLITGHSVWLADAFYTYGDVVGFMKEYPPPSTAEILREVFDVAHGHS